MTTPHENIIVDSCQYTPVYLIQTPGAIQGRSYVVTQNVEEHKPVSDNLKIFYETSGLLENNLVNSTSTTTRPLLLKKQDGKLVGNNLKLASFLLPKTENVNFPAKQYIAINNILAKPPPPPPVVNTSVPRVEVDRKIVRMTHIPPIVKTAPERIMPKSRPKENVPSPNPTQNSTKHTSVQLLKLGETYHSLNQLSDDQMKMVNQALKIFSDPEKAPMEPTYDPVTNTKFIYKVVSPRDLTVVGKNKLVLKNKKDKKSEIEEEPDTPPEVKVTRSGRKVKFPKQIVPEDAPQKPRKKSGTVVSCFQCSTEFCSIYRLQKHYENHPTHIPAKIHSNLFHCLLAIIKSGSEEDQANMFIQQLEQLIEKLKSLLPCLLKKIDGGEGTGCNVNDDIGRLFGMNPGKYNLNMDALTCVKDKDGFCRHNPAKSQFNTDPRSKPSQVWLSKHNEEIANNVSDSEDCARINAVDKWPTAHKRIWKIKKQKSNELKAKRMRMASESESVIELGVDDLIANNTTTNELSAINTPTDIILENKETQEVKNENKFIEEPVKVETEVKKPKPAHVQFHSTHFDIRSSPIKPSAAVFCKFQIDPDKIAKYDVQVIRPLDLDREQTVVPQDIPIDPLEIDPLDTNDDNCDLQSILRNEMINLTCKDNVSHELNFDTTKEWIMNGTNDKSNDSFMKSNGLIEPSLIHVTNHAHKLNNGIDHSAHLVESDIANNHLVPTNHLTSDLVETNHLTGDLVETDPLGSNLVETNHLVSSDDLVNNVHLTESDSDSRLLSNQGQSVLNFLDALGSDCLSYPETDIRNTTVDFQLDLFSFHNT